MGAAGAAGVPGRGVGAALIGAGIAVTALAAWQFARHRTTIIPGQTPTALVDTGLYRLSRNPIYVADALILAGLCLWWGAVSGLFLVPAFIWLIQKRFIDWEERRLRREFGAEFDRYAARVRRWI